MQSDGYYKIYKAFDGKEAFDLIKKDKPDLILLDVMIPEIDGFSLCNMIKEDKNLNSIQIIMLTAKKMLYKQYYSYCYFITKNDLPKIGKFLSKFYLFISRKCFNFMKPFALNN